MRGAAVSNFKAGTRLAAGVELTADGFAVFAQVVVGVVRLGAGLFGRDRLVGDRRFAKVVLAGRSQREDAIDFVLRLLLVGEGVFRLDGERLVVARLAARRRKRAVVGRLDSDRAGHLLAVGLEAVVTDLRRGQAAAAGAGGDAAVVVAGAQMRAAADRDLRLRIQFCNTKSVSKSSLLICYVEETCPVFLLSHRANQLIGHR